MVERCNYVLIVNFLDNKSVIIERLHTKNEDVCMKTHEMPAKRAKKHLLIAK